MKTNPTHLLHFVSIVENGSFGAAARELGISQPALSRSIKLLEERIGAQLLSRNRNGIALTEIGEMIYGHGQSMKISFDLASDLAAAISARKIGRLRIGATPYLADSLLADPVNRFSRQNGNVRLDVITATANELRRKLRSGKLDLAILPAEILHADDPVQYDPLFQDRTAIFAGARNPLALRQEIALADIAGQSWIGHPEESLLKFQMEACLLALGLSSINTAVQVHSRSLVIHLLEHQDLLTVLPCSYFKTELKAGKLSVLKLGAQFPERPIVMAYHSVMTPTPVARQFRSYVKKWARGLQA